MAVKNNEKDWKPNFSFLHDTNMKGNLELVDIDSIKLWEGNIKKHSRGELEKLAKGIDQFDQWRPAVVWTKDRQIRIGNGMYLAMRDILKRKKIWVLWHDFQSKAEADLAGMFDNKSGEWSEYDNDALRDLLTRGDIVNFTGKNKNKLKEFSGFSDEDLEKLFVDKDLRKLNDENPLCTVRIECRRDEKDDLISTLKEWSDDSGYTDLLIH